MYHSSYVSYRCSALHTMYDGSHKTSEEPENITENDCLDPSKTP